MGESPGDLVSIFDVMLDKAMQLCRAQIGVIFLYEDGFFEAIGMRGLPEAQREWFESTGRFETGRESGLGQIALHDKLVRIEDVTLDGAYENRDPQRELTPAAQHKRSGVLTRWRRAQQRAEGQRREHHHGHAQHGC